MLPQIGDDGWAIHHGDCIEHMAELDDAVFDMAVFSPPFPALYAYTSEAGDIGNSDDLKSETKLHLGFFYHQLSRVLKPGRVAVVHVAQIPRMKRAGGVGLFDFRGLNIRIGERAGLVYEYDWLVRKNPQAQAIRTKSRELQFSGLESDRAKTRGTLGDYLIKFRAPGENENAIDTKGQVTRNEWIDWAECAWMDIKETNTLNVRGTKGENDTKHICPLQLDVIKRCVKLFSNPTRSKVLRVRVEAGIPRRGERQYWKRRDAWLRRASGTVCNGMKPSNGTHYFKEQAMDEVTAEVVDEKVQP